MTEYKTKLLSEEDYKGFEPVYNDFRTRAGTDYNFELEPLTFEDFIDSTKKELIKCIILLEDSVPTAFLVYTTMISEAIELNIIHSLNIENELLRSKYLVEKFLEETEAERKNKIGTGDRSEKIRTYNYPQNRITDHRINFSIMQLDRVMEGALDPIIEALITEDQTRKLKGE